MFDLTSFDYIYIAVLAISTIWAFMRGGVYETLTMVSWVLAALAARWFSPSLNDTFQGWFNLTESTIGTIVASYFIVFFVILLLASFINQKLRDRIHDSFMRVTDHTFGVVFGILRGVVVMGLVYWGALWYYAESPLPDSIAGASTRPIMQLTALKMNEWFVPGGSALIAEDMMGEQSSQDIFDNLINPAIHTLQPVLPARVTADEGSTDLGEYTGMGYREADRVALDNIIMQLEMLSGGEYE